MTPIQFASLFGTLLIGMSPSFADDTAATITQASHKISHSMSATGPGESGAAGTAVRSGEFVKTGETSLAEMVLDDKTVTRLGPDTVFAYSSASREARVDSGTLLFSKPKDGAAMTFQMADVTAAVTGTTGFVQRTGDSVYLGVIEGTVHVTVGTANAVLQAGHMLVASGKTGQVVPFDVPHFVSTSAFFHSFQNALPNEPAIEHEIAAYHNMVARGFIAPAAVMPPSATDHRETMAAAHTDGREMAGSAINTALAGRSFSGAHSGAQGVAMASNGDGSSSAGLILSSGSLSVGNSGSGASTYTGVTSVSGGTINLGSGGTGFVTTNGGSTFGITINSGYSGTLNLTGGNTLIVGGSTYHLTGTSTVTIGSGVVTLINTTGTLSVNGGTLTNVNTSGGGAITLTGGNTYTGNVNGGISSGLTVSSSLSNTSGNTVLSVPGTAIHTVTLTTSGTH